MLTGPLSLVMPDMGNGHILWHIRFRLNIKERKKKNAPAGKHTPGTDDPERCSISIHKSDQAWLDPIWYLSDTRSRWEVEFLRLIPTITSMRSWGKE